MGLVYTSQYIDFEKEDWEQVKNNPPEFECKKDGVTLEIPDVNQKLYKIKFKEGAVIKCLRVTGKFRLTWNDEFLIEKT